jgi:hypothetical protein
MVDEFVRQTTGDMAAGRLVEAQLKTIRSRLDDGSGDIDLKALAEIEHDLLRLVREIRIANGQGFIARRADPWRASDSVNGALFTKDEGALDLPAGGYGAFAIAVEHSEATPVELLVRVERTGELADHIEISPFLVEFVTRADGVRLGDPLLPLAHGEFPLPMGETRQLWFSVKARDDADNGVATATVMMTAKLPSGEVTREVSIPITIWRVPQGTVPSTVVWGYLDGNLVIGKATEAVKDMLAHGVNTAVIPAWHFLPWPKPGASPLDKEIGDYEKFNDVFRRLSGHKQFLFFLSFGADSAVRTFGRRYEFLSEPWKALFLAWIKEFSEKLQASGLEKKQFAFYPVDEPHPGAEHDALVGVAKLIKSVDPDLQVFTTLHLPQTLSTDVSDTVDIFQLNGAALTAEVADRLLARGKTVWSYETTGDKAADPAAFYRSQGWDAFIMKLSGFGFWSYADTGRNGTAWNDIDGDRPDPAVVYEGSAHQIISSKRWEAWREGVQDFRLLTSAYQAARTAPEREEIVNLAENGKAHISDQHTLNEVRRLLFSKQQLRSSSRQ